MPIKVACSCGQAFAAPDHLAGRAVKCPKCSQPLNIPAAQPQQPATPAGGLADLLAEEGLAMKAGSGPQCPSCSAPMPPHGFLCVQCGYNVQAGRKVQMFDESELSATRDAQQRIAKAREELKKTPQQFTGEDMGAGASAYLATAVILVATLVLIGIGAGFLYIFETYIYKEDGGASQTTAMVSFIFGGIMFSIGRIWMLVIAFLEGIVQGLLCLFCDIYFLYYLITRFSDAKLPVFMCVFGYIMFIVGALTLGFAG